MKRLLCFMLLLVVAASSGAMAQDAQLYNPTSAWLVGPSSVAARDNGSGMPCLMLDQYDNGFTFRISGGDGKILAMAIDFHQPAFRPGQHYPLTVTIDAHFTRRFDAPAYDDSVLIVSAQDAETATALYKAMAGGQRMTVSLGKQSIDFALLGIVNGLQRLEACYGVSPAPAAEHLAGAGPAIPKIVVHPASPPPSLGGVDPALKQTLGATASDDAISRPPADDAAVAAGATAQSGIMSAPPPSSQPEPSAVNTSLPEPTAPPVAAIPPGKPADEPGDAPAPASGTGPWQARSHDSLRATLAAWSARRGADLVWQYSGDLPVPESLTMDGTYEQAVEALLAEYENANPRPAGGLIIDPSNGRRQLTIRPVGQ